MALDGRVKGDDTSLASSTLLADENNRDIFGLVVSYAVKVNDCLFGLLNVLSVLLPVYPRILTLVASSTSLHLYPR